MDKINCLIVDDEPIAREIIKTFCSHLAMLQVVAACQNALEAKVELHRQKVDLVFLDINMPVLDGIAFMKTLRTPPQVIFTTAYREYAVDAFDLSACDYLVKPFSLERFIMAVDKAIERLKGVALPKIELPAAKGEDFLFVKAEGKIYKVLHQELLYAEAQGNNTKLVTQHQTLSPVMTFSALEEVLPKASFLRVHRSFIVNKAKITHLEGNRVLIGKTEIPIGSNYKEQFLKSLGL